MSRFHLASLALSGGLLVGLVWGCQEGSPAQPAYRTPVTPPGPAVGPAPLRRLTGTEYLYALHDLFPTFDLILPPLPADIPVNGFDNAAASQEPSDVLISRYETIAGLYAQAATVDGPTAQAVLGCTDWSTAAKATACVTGMLQKEGARIFRRPMTAAETGRYLTSFQGWQAQTDFLGAVQLTLTALLQSPQFIYRVEPLPPDASAGAILPVDPYAMATRLSFFLWESIPDDTLLAAAGANELGTVDQLRAQATRMLDDERAKRVFWDFHRQWLYLDRILLPEGLTRTAQVDPDWTAATQASAEQETELFVQNTLAGGGTFHDLLLSPSAWVDGEMSRVYGLSAPADPTVFAPTTLPGSQRAGVLTRVAFLAGYSHAGATSPPVRGNGIELRLLCELPISPPPGVNLSQPMAAPDAGPETNRELFEQRTSPPMCQGCHAGLNGIGFGFESYDAAGHFQTTDDGLPVDATGTLIGADVGGPFDGALQLSKMLSTSETVHACAAESWVRFALGRAPVAAESPGITSLASSFLQDGGDVRGLMLAIVTSPTFRQRVVEDD